MEMTNIPEIFGSMVFDDRQMRKRLSEEVYTALKTTIEQNVRLDDKLAEARLALVTVTAHTIRHALGILGVSAPEKM